MNTTMTTTPAKTGIKKLNLGGIAQKTEKAGKEYPLLPDPDEKGIGVRLQILTDERLGIGRNCAKVKGVRCSSHWRNGKRRVMNMNWIEEKLWMKSAANVSQQIRREQKKMRC